MPGRAVTPSDARAVLLASLLGCGEPERDAPICDPRPDLDRAAAATAWYVDPSVALDAGYLPASACESDASGAAMGLHYTRLADSLDQEHDVEVPEILLYVPEGDGLRLVGLEFVRPALAGGEARSGEIAPEGEVDPPPELFCRPFDGPMAGHVAAQPWHYDLHVWLYSENPEGLFAQYNPAEDCLP